MFAKFSPENRMKNFIDRENSSTHFLALLVSLRDFRGLSQSRLSQAVRGKALDNETGKHLSELISQLPVERHLAESPQTQPLVPSRQTSNRLGMLRRSKDRSRPGAVLQVVPG